MGYKDYSSPENALDGSDRDCAIGQDSLGRSITECAKDAGMINIQLLARAIWHVYARCHCTISSQWTKPIGHGQ